jgi:hypothetical protein
MCTTLQTSPVGAVRVANRDRRTGTYVAGAKVRNGVQEDMDWVMVQIFDNRGTL